MAELLQVFNLPHKFCLKGLGMDCDDLHDLPIAEEYAPLAVFEEGFLRKRIMMPLCFERRQG
jgi:hypothetical protein